ncbi:uncharacterized protein [Magallana gigas]|uniref:uncharacterized protein isoform X3 n=1 Tax=Magallana gigas TaxID=29159 RepID=UPI00333E2205
MDSFDKVNDGVNSNKCATDDNVRMNLMNQRSKTIDEWILKRKEAWKFQEELLGMVGRKQEKEERKTVGCLSPGEFFC